MSQTVNLLNPDGELVALPQSQAHEALQAGYSVPSSQDIQAYKDKSEYGEGFGNEAKAFAESAASSATFGVSRELEKKLGISTPEAQAKRAEQNPVANVVGTATGVAGSLFLGPEMAPVRAATAVGKGITSKALPHAEKLASSFVNPETSPLVHHILSKGGAHALGSAVEGAAFGLGQSVDESALGDPDALGEKLIHNVGFGAALGGGFGAVFGPLGKVGKVAKSEATQSALQDEIATAGSSHAAQAEAASGLQSMSGPETMQAPFKDFPKSLGEIKSAVNDAGLLLPEGMPARGALKDAVNNLPDLQFKPHALQYESLEDQHLRDFYKGFLESGGDDAKALRDYEGLQKSEGVAKLNYDVKDLSPSKKVTEDVVTAGEKTVNAFTETYEAEKKELAPAFKKFDELAKTSKADAGNVILKLQDTGLGLDAEKLVQITEDGKFHVEPYSPDMAISKNTHGAIKDLLKTLNKEDVTISQLRNVRESMRDRLTLAKGPRDEAQIGAIRKALMDEMQERVGKIGDEGLRDTFMRFAKNEERRGVIEKIFGGSISDKASFGKQIKSEDVLNRIFGDTVAVKAAKEVLGAKFDQVLADFISHKIASFTDNAKNGFSSQKFSSFLRSKAPELSEAFAEKPQKLKRLSALADYMRILPDSPSVNPSGTAKTLGILERVSMLGKVLDPKKTLIDFGEKYAQKLEAQKQKSVIEEILKGQKLDQAQMSSEARSSHYSALAKLERASHMTTNAIKESAKSIFTGFKDSGTAASGFVGSKIGGSKGSRSASNDKSDIIAQLNDLQNNPEKFVDHLEDITKDLYPIAPNAAHSLQASMAKAVQFLQSKAPQRPNMAPLEKPMPHSMFELKKFEKYQMAVEDPVAVLDQVRGCEIGPEAVETLQAVYPKLYQEMASTVMDEMTNHVSKEGVEGISYSTKLGLSMFLQQDMHSSLSQQSIAANQMSLASNGQAQAQQPQKVNQAGLSKLKSAPNMLTASQASAQRPTT